MAINQPTMVTGPLKSIKEGRDQSRGTIPNVCPLPSNQVKEGRSDPVGTDSEPPGLPRGKPHPALWFLNVLISEGPLPSNGHTPSRLPKVLFDFLLIRYPIRSLTMPRVM